VLHDRQSSVAADGYINGDEDTSLPNSSTVNQLSQLPLQTHHQSSKMAASAFTSSTSSPVKYGTWIECPGDAAGKNKGSEYTYETSPSISLGRRRQRSLALVLRPRLFTNVTTSALRQVHHVDCPIR